MLERLRQLRAILNGLNDNRITRVDTLKGTNTLVLSQVGGIKIVLSQLVGFINIGGRRGLRGILTPDDLYELKEGLSYVVDYFNEDSLMISPVKYGYDIYSQGDILVTSTPTITRQLRLVSITNKILLRYLRWRSDEIFALYHK